MKSVFALVTLGILLSTTACSQSGSNTSPAPTDLVAEKSFTISECPFLEGTYRSGNMSMKITESRFADAYRVVLGEGSQELTINGRTQSINASANYVGTCSKGILQIEASGEGRYAKMRYYFNDKLQLVQEQTGEGAETSVWEKR